MKSLLNKNKSKQKKKNKNIDKIIELENELVKIKHSINSDKLQPELKELNKIHAVNKNIQENK